MHSIFILSSTLDWYLEVKIRVRESIRSVCRSYRQKSQGAWRDWLECTTSYTIIAQCMEKTSRCGILINIDIATEKGFTFYQTRSNAIILQETLPAYCILKVVRLKTGEVFNEKVYMSLPLPPKISLKHEWTRELEVVRQPEGEVARQAQFCYKPNQLQIQFVTDQGDLTTCKMEETRPIHRRPMLILLPKNSVLQTERDDQLFLKTVRVSMLSRIMTERSDLLLLLILLKHKTTLEYFLFMTAIRSTLMMKYFVKEWKNPLLFMTRIMDRWWWTRQTWTSEFLHYHFPLWNMRTVPASKNWVRKLRTTQVDMLFNNIHCKINHLILSVQNQKMIRDVGNIELCELLETEPKTQ